VQYEAKELEIAHNIFVFTFRLPFLITGTNIALWYGKGGVIKR